MNINNMRMMDQDYDIMILLLRIDIYSIMQISEIMKRYIFI